MNSPKAVQPARRILFFYLLPPFLASSAEDSSRIARVHGFTIVSYGSPKFQTPARRCTHVGNEIRTLINAIRDIHPSITRKVYLSDK